MVLGKEVDPLGLSIGEGGLSEDGFDGGVVAMDGEGAVVEVVTPELEGLDKAEELFVVGRVRLLGVLVFGGMVGDDSFVGADPLSEDSPGGGGRGVGVEVERGGRWGRSRGRRGWGLR